MNGIDVSNWQKGINLNVVPCDFVIIKATQGTSYVSPDYKRQIEQALSAGKCVGVYHYVGGQGASAEAQHFYNNIKEYLGRVVICVDWESEQNSKWGNTSYLDSFMKEINNRTGIPAMIYASYSSFPWDIARNNNAGTWVAQYANYNQTGYQSNPWNEGKYSCTIRQYSSSGRLNGYNGNLDLNKAYIDRNTWNKYANPKGNTVPSTPSNPPSNVDGNVLDLVIRTRRGEFGNGEDRKRNLGNRYDEVQGMINHIASASNDVLANEVIAGKYGNGDTRKNVLGDKYNAVQNVVNSKSNKKSIDQVAREVIRGDWGNGTTRKNRLEAAGYNYNEVQKRVNQLL